MARGDSIETDLQKSPLLPERPDPVAAFEAERAKVTAQRRVYNAVFFVGTLILFIWSFSVGEIFGGEIGNDPLGRMLTFLDKMTPDLEPSALMAGAETPGSISNWYYGMPLWGPALLETVQMAVFATVLGTALSIPAALLCSRNLIPYAPLRGIVRRTLEAIRTLPDVIVAMILVAAFGIGPLAGVITIVLSTVGRLGKLFSEINENADMRQLEGIRSSGGSWWDQIRYGLFPQVAPGYASYAMLKFEGNISAAAALGIVGAGGIGIELSRAITYIQFTDYLAILLMMTVLIFAIDITSEAIRHRLIGVKVATA